MLYSNEGGEKQYAYTVEPPNKGHIGTRSFVLHREMSFIRRLKCTGIIGIRTSRFVLYREVSFIGGFTVQALMDHQAIALESS